MVTGFDDAWEFAPAGLQTIATKLWVATADWLTVVEITEPDPVCSSSCPVVVSKIESP